MKMLLFSLSTCLVLTAIPQVLAQEDEAASEKEATKPAASPPDSEEAPELTDPSTAVPKKGDAGEEPEVAPEKAGGDGSPEAEEEEVVEPPELVLKDGRVLKDFRVRGQNETTLTIFHSTGAANVPAHLLPPEVAKAYNVNPKLSLEQEQAKLTRRTEQTTAELRARNQLRPPRKSPGVTVEGAVKSVSPDGVVIEIEEPQELAGKAYQRIGGKVYDKAGRPVEKYAGRIFGTVWVTGHPLQADVVDGDRLRFRGKVSGRHQIEGKTYLSIRFERAAP